MEVCIAKHLCARRPLLKSAQTQRRRISQTGHFVGTLKQLRLRLRVVSGCRERDS